jgi:hypothetical protein
MISSKTNIIGNAFIYLIVINYVGLRLDLHRAFKDSDHYQELGLKQQF